MTARLGSPQSRRLSSTTTMVTELTMATTCTAMTGEPSPKSSTFRKRKSSPATTVSSGPGRPATVSTTMTTSLITITEPWRSPGPFWTMPDIIKDAWDQSKRKQQLIQPHHTLPTHSGIPLEMAVAWRPLWRPFVKAPDVFPLPPVPCKPASPTPRSHAEFEAKLRRILCKAKRLDASPYDHYVTTSKIGHGTNGAVVRADRRLDGRGVAIKKYLIEDHDRRHHTYVLRELRIMSRLRHPNLVELVEACVWVDHLWVIMELMQCSVFGLLFRAGEGLAEPLAVHVTRQCLQGLCFLHAQGYMHRDVKCENILVGLDGVVKLADFGLAAPWQGTTASSTTTATATATATATTATSTTSTTTTATVRHNTARLGTAKWMAPEVVSQQPYTATIDIWSLGITVIEMMDRVPPLYYLESEADIFRTITSDQAPVFHFAGPSDCLVRLVQWMTTSNGIERPTAKEVLARLESHLTSHQLVCAPSAHLAHMVRSLFA